MTPLLHRADSRLAPEREARVLPPDVFDTLEFVAEVHGGVGGGRFNDSGGNPLCIIGLRNFAITPDEVAEWCELGNRARFTVLNNDRAVYAINERLGNAPCNRVTFAQWCEELGVVRGES